MSSWTIVKLISVMSAFLLFTYAGAIELIVDSMPPFMVREVWLHNQLNAYVILAILTTTVVPILDMIEEWWRDRAYWKPSKERLARSFAKQMLCDWPEAYQLGSNYFVAKLPSYVFAITTMHGNGTRVVVGHGIRIRGFLVTLRHIISQPSDLWITMMSVDGQTVTVTYDAPIDATEWKDLPGALADVCYMVPDKAMQIREAPVGPVVLNSCVNIVSSQMPMNASSGPIVEDTIFATFRHKASTKPGWSGCPVMSNGQVVGLHAGGGCHSNYGYATAYISMVLHKDEDTDEIALKSVLRKNPWAKYKVNHTNDPDVVEIEVTGKYYRLDSDVWGLMEEEFVERQQKRGKSRRWEYDDDQYENAVAPPSTPVMVTVAVQTDIVMTLTPEVVDVGPDEDPTPGPKVTEYTISGNLMTPRGGATRADPASLLRGATRLVEKAHLSQDQAWPTTDGLKELETLLNDRLSAMLATVQKQGEELNRQQSENAKLHALFSRLSTKFESLTTPVSMSPPKPDEPVSIVSSEASTSADLPESVNLAAIPPSEPPSGGTEFSSQTPPCWIPSATRSEPACHALQAMIAQSSDEILQTGMRMVRRELARRSQRQ